MRLKTFWEKGRKAFVPYLMVGYPDYETSLEAFRRVLKAGADILEIGFPFSDPVADGPTIQVAHDIALKNRIRSEHVFELASTLRGEFPHIPFLLMTYYNPMYRIGLAKFCEKAKEAGIDGFIVPDLPPEEGQELKEVCQSLGLCVVFLASPTSTEKRLRLICQSSDSMVYFVSLTGTTGARESLPFERLEERLRLYRSLCNKPVVVGFGVSKPEHAKKIAQFAEGVVVGSLFVKLAGDKNLAELELVAREIKEAIR